MNNGKKIQQFAKEQLKKDGRTQEQVSKEIGVHNGYLWQNSMLKETIRLNRLTALFKELDCTVKITNNKDGQEIELKELKQTK